jgi:holliday junction DNA helicase RuvA
MIASLTGIVAEKTDDALIVSIGGVGYEVFVTVEDWGGAKVGKEARYYIYEQIREDAHNLYGFSMLEAKQLFTQLLSVSGVGPKMAMTILSAATLTRLKQAIVSGDPDLLKGIAGVGKKTAERVIVELRGKVKDGGSLNPMTSSDPTYQALVGLGYTAAQAAEAVAAIPDSIKDDQARIKAALKAVAK